jgi:hypothetical protein
MDTRLSRCDLLEEQAKVLLEYQNKGILIPGGINPSEIHKNCKAIREELIKDKFMKIDWRNSKAHLLLLSKFIQANRFEAFAASDYWKNQWDNILGEPSKQAINRFIDEGMLADVTNLNDLLSFKYKVTELRDMLKERGLPVSGRKEAMISRLVQADPEGIKKSVAELSLLKCTQRGQEIAEHYLEAEKERRVQVERQVMEYLTDRKFREASLAVAAYEAEQVFPRGMGIDWKHHNPKQDIGTLETIFEGKLPKILVNLGNEKLQAFRIASAMMALWGENKAKKWLPDDFETGSPFDFETAVRMLNFQAVHKSTLERYRNEGIEYVEVLPASDSCEFCRKLAGKHYKLAEAPELPNPNCTNKMGCRCCYLPVV